MYFYSCRLNKCGVISPRYDIKHGELEAWVARLLPSRLVSISIAHAALRALPMVSIYFCWHSVQDCIPQVTF